MTTRSLAAALALLLCVAMMSYSCKKGCGSCPNFGNISGIGTNVAEVCTNNICMCPNGLEGDSCQTLSLLKYFQPSATWQATDNCNSSQYYVTMSYNQSSNAYNNVFYINGLFGGGAQVEADILSNASHQGVNLYIPAQSTPSGTINSGSGLYQSTGGFGKITLNLDYTNNSGLEIPCTVFLYQQ